MRALGIQPLSVSISTLCDGLSRDTLKMKNLLLNYLNKPIEYQIILQTKSIISNSLSSDIHPQIWYTISNNGLLPFNYAASSENSELFEFHVMG